MSVGIPLMRLPHNLGCRRAPREEHEFTDFARLDCLLPASRQTASPAAPSHGDTAQNYRRALDCMQRPYNPHVRRVAAVTFVVLAFVHLTDPILCPDGCADEARHTRSSTLPRHGAPSPCLLCHSSITAGPDSPTAVTAFVALPRIRQAKAALLSQPGPRIEHPPRLT